MEMENQQQQLQLFCFYCQKNSNFSHYGQTNFLLTFSLKTKYIWVPFCRLPYPMKLSFSLKLNQYQLINPTYLMQFQPDVCILSFEFCLWLFQVRLFDTSQTLKSCPDVRQIIFVAKQHKYCQQPKLHNNVCIVCYRCTFKMHHHLLMPTPHACVSCCVSAAVYQQFHQASFVSLFIPQLPTLQYFLSPGFILFPEFSITSRRFYCYEIQLC